jgi:magnesium transporter
MIDSRSRILTTSVRKLLRRGATRNIQRILSKTHTADIAVVLDQFESEDRVRLLQMEPSDERRAEILSYLDKRTQQELLEALSKEQVQKLVGLMDSDDAVELLRNLEEDFSQDILKSMGREDQDEVQNLLRYPEDSAGGHMTSDILAFKQELTAVQAIQEIQARDDESLVTFYIYVVDDARHLVGVVSLKQLLLAKPHEPLASIMSSDVIRASVDLPQTDVARMVERYDFLAIPVVDEGNRLVGAVTVDDVIDVIREEAQEDLLAIGQVGSSGEFDGSTRAQLRNRIPSLSLSFFSGFICFVLIDFIFVTERGNSVSAVSAFVPLLIAFGSTASTQAATWTIGLIRAGQFDRRAMGAHFLAELQTTLVLGLGFGTLLYAIARLTTGAHALSALIACVLVLQVAMAAFVGNVIPIVLQKVRLDPAVAAISILTATSNVASVALIYGAAVVFFDAPSLSSLW